MYSVENKGQINTVLDGKVITIYTDIDNIVLTYRLFINGEYKTSGKYTKGSGLLNRPIHYNDIKLIVSTDIDDSFILDVEVANV